MTAFLLALATFFLAYANGANDNFKGVATLYGSGSKSYRGALVLANITTLLGSLASLFLAQALIAKFGGKGLVPDAVAGSPRFALSVASAAAGTVLLATRFGFPISTTHAIMGALVGAGLVASPSGVSWGALGQGFLKPLLLSPFLALAGALLVYPLFQRLRRVFKVEKDSCLCLQEAMEWTPSPVGAAELAPASALRVTRGKASECSARYSGTLLGVEAQVLLDWLHTLSAGLVGFARGLNDTPKIAALLMFAGLGGAPTSTLLVGAAVLLGGWLGARRVAETMSHGITDMNPGQGFSANLVTSALVIGASALGSPVSTTHVSCGALFGIGASSGKARWRTVAGIAGSWVVTLPVAGLLGYGAAALLAR